MVDIDRSHNPRSGQPETRQDRRRERTRGALLDAALRLFAERGFDETTVQAITEAADAGKGTFFHHFPTKDHVLVAYWNAFNARLLDELEGIRKRTVRTRLLAAMEVCGARARAESALGRVLLARVMTSPALAESDRRNEERLGAWFAGVLADGVERGEVPPTVDLDSLQYLLIASLSSTFRDYIASGEGDPVKLLVRRTRLLLTTLETQR